MPLFTFLNKAGEVLTVVGPTDHKPSIEQCPGAASVVEGDSTAKGAKRAATLAEPAQPETIETLKARFESEIASLKSRLPATETKTAVLEAAKTAESSK